MNEGDWAWPRSDKHALEELEFRIEKAARNKGFLDYSELVKGVTFKIPTINDGGPFEIDVRSWRDIDRAILGQFLGYISMKSYEKHDFMLSAIVIGRNSSEPSHHFYQWVKWLGMLSDTSENGMISFWAKHFKAAHRHYSK